ncbi:LysR family transcriptional regulator [Falsiroseomonas stagni]|uniref:DNA-binding transcriptional regulator, LysR family n=1 Tax=Falsiroseomonas stagni DSM 19981 TaxID=1123062 RepID=A0A1I3YAW6_9PROT|nr:LysR family transcriptional regulator [Falsiroseomonas stagni]SFK28952.1 DNA-binding transcriptional regulator, LysR family [Falsiroseomonas stagni DSM 19981]
MKPRYRPNWATLGLDLVTLRIFAAAAEERSLARAAEREHIAQSAVSRRIAELEGRVGVQLLRRHDRGVEPTAAGLMLLDRLADLFGLLERMAAELDAHAGGARGSVVLHANISAISGRLPDLLSSFLQAHPGLRVSLEERTSVEILHAVQTGVAELGLFSATVPVPEGLTVLPWREDPLMVLLPPGHPLAARAGLRLADLLDEPFVGLQDPSALQRLYRAEAARIGGHLRERVLVASFDGVRRLVEAGLGLSILPAAAMPAGGALPTRRLEEPWAVRPLALCLRQPEGLSAAARLLVGHLTSP